MTLPSVGLIIGGFRVPHAGHDHLIRSAVDHCQKLRVLVMARSNDLIPGALRHAWLRSAHPEREIKLVEHDLPTDYSDPEVWSRWTALISSNLEAPPDILFSSEGYGNELARRLGCVHRLVDQERRTVPVSATAILQDPQGNARFISAEVLHYVEGLPLLGRNGKQD